MLFNEALTIFVVLILQDIYLEKLFSSHGLYDGLVSRHAKNAMC